MSDELKCLRDKCGNRLIILPYISNAHKLWINRALKMYSEFRPADALYIKNIMIMISNHNVFHEDQFRTVLRAVLCFRLNIPTESKILHDMVNNIIIKLKGVMHDYGLDSNKGD